jgi:tRNA (guanosine-2'-O-)-methyltransferase
VGSGAEGSRQREPQVPDAEIVRVLLKHVSPRRLRRMLGVLNSRVADTALVLENLHDPHNASACLRTAEALGVQNVHVITRWGDPLITRSGADKGTVKWLTLHMHACAADCVAALHAQGYAVFATALDPRAVDLAAAVQQSLRRPPALAPAAGHEHGGDRALEGGAVAESSDPLQSAPASALMPRCRPRVALVLGNEHRGTSRAMRAAADATFFIPQAGFVQSFNVSVACGLAVSAFLHRTPDYAPWVAAAAAARLLEELPLPAATATARAGPGNASVLAGSQPEVGSASAMASAAPPLGISTEQGGSPRAHAAREPAGPLVELRMEPLPTAERDAVLARWLLAEVPNAEGILDRHGVRPDEL